MVKVLSAEIAPSLHFISDRIWSNLVKSPNSIHTTTLPNLISTIKYFLKTSFHQFSSSFKIELQILGAFFFHCFIVN